MFFCFEIERYALIMGLCYLTTTHIDIHNNIYRQKYIHKIPRTGFELAVLVVAYFINGGRTLAMSVKDLMFY